MRDIGNFQYAPAAISAELPLVTNPPDAGEGTTRVDLEFVLPVKNSGVAAHSFLVSDLQNALRCELAQLKDGWGDSIDSMDVRFNDIGFDYLCEGIRKMTDDDVLVLAPAGTLDTLGRPVRLGDALLAPTTVLINALAAGAEDLTSIRIIVPLTFEMGRFDEESQNQIAGSLQMRKYRLKLTRAGSFDPTNGWFVRVSAMTMIVSAHTVTIPKSEEPYARPWRLMVKKPGDDLRYVRGPDFPCGLVAVWERSKTGVQTLTAAANTVSTFTLKSDDGVILESGARAQRVQEGAALDTPPSFVGSLTANTDFFSLPEHAKPDNVPIGRGWSVFMPLQELAAPEFVFAHLPIPTPASLEAAATTQTRREGRPVVAAIQPEGADKNDRRAALSPTVFVAPDDPRFHSADRIEFQHGKTAGTVKVSDETVALAKASAGAHKAGAAKVGAAELASGKAARRIPGGIISTNPLAKVSKLGHAVAAKIAQALK